MPVTSMQLISMGFFSFVFFILKNVYFFLLKRFYLYSVSRLGNHSIRWILEHDNLEEIGLTCHWRHPGLSVIFFIVFSTIPLRSANWTMALFTALFLGQLFSIAWIDASTGYIPNVLNYFLISSGIFSKWMMGGGCLPWYKNAGQVLLIYFLFWIVQQVLQKAGYREKIGQGDVFFFAGIGAWLNWEEAFYSFLIGNLFALLVCLVSAQRRLRYTPYLAYGTLIVLYMHWLIPHIHYGSLLSSNGL